MEEAQVANAARLLVAARRTGKRLRALRAFPFH
jgi:hypothetical protein